MLSIQNARNIYTDDEILTQAAKYILANYHPIENGIVEQCLFIGVLLSMDFNEIRGCLETKIKEIQDSYK
jgi:hypothetical protein